MISIQNTDKVIDRSKARRARKRTREKVVAENNIYRLQALFFDGRKDKTIQFVRIQRRDSQ